MRELDGQVVQQLGGALRVAGDGDGAEPLESYEVERRQIGDRNVKASTQASVGRRNWRAEWRPEITEDSPAGEAVRERLAKVADDEQRWSNDLLGIELGYRYSDSPLIVDEPGVAPASDSFSYTPSTWPGTRVPHVWAKPGVGVQDLVGLTNAYTLLRIGPNPQPETELAEAFSAIDVPFQVVDVDNDSARKVYEHRLILLRPDLHIAWRGEGLPADAAALARLVTGN